MTDIVERLRAIDALVVSTDVGTFTRELRDAEGPVCKEAAAEIERLRCDLARNAWRSIETAPKDGTRFLGYWKNFGVSVVHRHDPGGAAKNPKHHYECWVNDDNYPFSGSHLTHWMPLPSFPDLQHD